MLFFKLFITVVIIIFVITLCGQLIAKGLADSTDEDE